MRITSVELPGFGCLSGFGCELGPGLNLFFGDNEAGKSTLQQAICAMLYGFYDNDRARPDESARHDRLRPWGGGTFRGALAYELENGNRYEVRRDFSTTDVITQVIDQAVGVDISPQFGRGRHGNVPFAKAHIGMTRGVFQSCAFISQGEIFDLDKNASPGQIGDAIAALADSNRRDVSAARAIDKLDATAGKIGSDRARTAELPVARDQLRRAKDELSAADEARRSLAEKSRRLDELQAKAAQFAEQALRAEYAGHTTEATRLREQLKKLDDAESLLARASARMGELESFAAIPGTTRDQVLNLRGQHERAAAAVARLHSEREAHADHLSPDMRLEYETLRLSVGVLTDEQVRGLESVAYTVAQAPGPEATGIISAIGRLLAASARGVAALFRSILRRKPAPPALQPKPAPSLTRADAVALLEKHRRYLTLRPLMEEAHRLESQVEAEIASLGLVEAQVRSLLRSTSIEADELGAGLIAFDDAWQKRETYGKAQAAAEQADARRTALLGGRSREEIAESLAEHETAAREMVAAHPRLEKCQTNSSPEQLARTAQQARQNQHAAEVAATRLEEEVRLTMDRFRPRAETEEEIARWSREVARLERGRAALQLAKATIEEAMTNVYRDFAPAVNTFLCEGIEAATDGRYHRAHVDPSTLRVSLLVPETGLVVTDPPVSHGTRTLLYVLMRIGLAQHMSAIGEPVPLVLDDPFVDVDSRRLRRILDFLLHLSDRMQVLIFTKDREIVSWFEENALGERHRVHPMSAAVTANML